MVLVAYSDVTKNEKYVGMKAEKYGDKIITHYKVETTQSGCVLASHTHTFISTSVAVLCKL